MVHLAFRARVTASSKERPVCSSRAGRSFRRPAVGRDGVLGLYSTKLVSICVHFYARCIYLRRRFLQILGEQRSLRCGSGGGCGRVEMEEARLAAKLRWYMQRCETMSTHRTNDQDSDDLLGRFRLALHTVERSPSDEAVGELRSAAAPIFDRLRAEYRAAGHTDDDCHRDVSLASCQAGGPRTVCLEISKATGLDRACESRRSLNPVHLADIHPPVRPRVV